VGARLLVACNVLGSRGALARGSSCGKEKRLRAKEARSRG
jgi:hypothetical protein